MATRFSNSYAFFQGVDDQLKYNTARDANARAEAAAEDARKKAVQDLLMSQAAEERTATTFASQDAARRLAEAQASAGLDTLSTELPTLRAERGLNIKSRDAAVIRGTENFPQTQAQLDEREKLKLTAGDQLAKQIRANQELKDKFPQLTDPVMRGNIANLLALNVPIEDIIRSNPEFAPYLQAAPSTATAVAGLPSPVTTVTQSVTNAQKLASDVAKATLTGDNALTLATQKAADAAALATQNATARAALETQKSAAKAGGATMTPQPVQPFGVKQAVPTAAAPATAPTKAAAPTMTPVDIAGQQLDLARANLKLIQDSPRPGLSAGTAALLAYSNKLKEAQRAVAVSEMAYQSALPQQTPAFPRAR